MIFIGKIYYIRSNNWLNFEAYILRNKYIKQAFSAAILYSWSFSHTEIGWHYKYSCQCSLNGMPHFTDSNNWRMVMRQTPYSHWLNVYYWWEIWRTCRPQQSNIFCLKKGWNSTNNMQSYIIPLKISISKNSNKGQGL